MLPAFPVFVVVRETGDIYVHRQMSEVRFMASEFWDILDQNFLFFGCHRTAIGVSNEPAKRDRSGCPR